MARVIGALPFENLVLVDTQEKIEAEYINRIAESFPIGVSICVRPHPGPEKRGGYFFHFRKLEETYELVNAHGTPAIQIQEEELVKLINHCSGLEFSSEIFQLFQAKLNFKSD